MRSIRSYEQAVLSFLRDLKPDRPADAEPNRSRYQCAAGNLAKVCAARIESFESACDRLRLADKHRAALLEADGPAAEALRKFREPNAPRTSMRPDEKSLRRAEQSAIGYLSHLRTDRPLDVEPNRWAIQSATARLASVCTATGEDFEQICNRLEIAEAHRNAMLAIPGSGSRRLRALSTKGHEPVPVLTLNDKVSRNERTALGYLRGVRPDRPLDVWSNKSALQQAAGRLAAVCEATGQRFAKVCDRLRISELNKNALLIIPGTGSERLRKFHNGRWSNQNPDHTPASEQRRALADLLSTIIAGCPHDVEPNRSRFIRAADRLAKLCAATGDNFFEVCDWLKINEVERIALVEMPDPDHPARRSGDRQHRQKGYSERPSRPFGIP